MRTGIIYQATNLINGKMYIGQTIRKLKTRITEHYHNVKNSNNKFSNALQKYSKENWKWEILVDNVPIGQLNLFEKSYIWGLSTFEFGYNSTTGGSEASTVSEDTRNKLSRARLGKPLSEETKNKISLSTKGKFISEGHRKIISKSKLGIPRTEETKKKISEKRIKNGIALGSKNPFYGKKHSQETKNILSDVRSVVYYEIITPAGNVEIIKNLYLYCKNHNLDDRAMRRVIKNEYKQHKGYKVKHHVQ